MAFKRTRYPVGVSHKPKSGIVVIHATKAIHMPQNYTCPSILPHQKDSKYCLAQAQLHIFRQQGIESFTICTNAPIRDSFLFDLQAYNCTHVMLYCSWCCHCQWCNLLRVQSKSSMSQCNRISNEPVWQATIQCGRVWARLRCEW